MKIFINLITTTRFLYTIALTMFSSNLSNAAFIVNIVLLFLSDMVDGILARKFKVQSLYGAVMDAVADKTLCIFLLIALIYHDLSFLLLLILEVIIAIINVTAFFVGKKPYSRLFGKVKMWSISISIIIGYMVCFGKVDVLISQIIMIITIILQFFTVIDYIVSIIRQKENKRQGYKIKNKDDLKYVLFDTEYYLNIKY